MHTSEISVIYCIKYIDVVQFVCFQAVFLNFTSNKQAHYT